MILEILKKYSDPQHKMTQPDIIGYLDTDYGVTCDRRSVKRNILDLIELGYQINLEGGYYLEGRDFNDEEICLLYDSILQNSHLTKQQMKGLIQKISSYANVYFNVDPEGIRNAAGTYVVDVREIFETIAVVKDAIERKRKISFAFISENNRKNSDQCVVNPYEIIAAGQDYYLLCSHNETETLDIVRIKAMDNVNVLGDKIRPLSQIKGAKKKVPSLQGYAQQLAPNAENEIQFTLIADRSMTDWIRFLFGSKVKLADAEDGKVKISVKSAETNMLRFAMAYCDLVKVTVPEDFSLRIEEQLKKIIET